MKTFEQISPRWASVIKANGWPDDLGIATGGKLVSVKGKHLNMNNFTSCIVGEAHHFRRATGGNYNCSTCTTFSNEFYLQALTEKEFSKIRDRFVRHWNKVHVKPVARRVK